MPDDRTIWMESGVAEDGYPFVKLTWDDKKCQLSVEEARQHALAILETAEAAEYDAAYWHFLQSDLKVDRLKAAMLVGELRKHRGKHKGFTWKTG